MKDNEIKAIKAQIALLQNTKDAVDHIIENEKSSVYLKKGSEFSRQLEADIEHLNIKLEEIERGKDWSEMSVKERTQALRDSFNK